MKSVNRRLVCYCFKREFVLATSIKLKYHLPFFNDVYNPGNYIKKL